MSSHNTLGVFGAKLLSWAKRATHKSMMSLRASAVAASAAVVASRKAIGFRGGTSAEGTAEFRRPATKTMFATGADVGGGPGQSNGQSQVLCLRCGRPCDVCDVDGLEEHLLIGAPSHDRNSPEL